MAEIDDLRIAAVRMLHSPMHSPLGDVYCAHCSNQEMVEWPCLTVEALGPREDSEAPAVHLTLDEIATAERLLKAATDGSSGLTVYGMTMLEHLTPRLLAAARLAVNAGMTIRA